jgi:hypothetical protein
MDVIHFTQVAADSLIAFDSCRASFLPLADGNGNSHISCLHIERNASIPSPQQTTPPRSGCPRPHHRRNPKTSNPHRHPRRNGSHPEKRTKPIPYTQRRAPYS